MKEIFISYSTIDAPQAEMIRNILENNDCSCWMAPRDIPGGSNYTKEIPIAIRNCKVFLLILSTHSQSSSWVLKELDSAVNNGKIILPFMLENFDLNDEFNFLLSGTQRYTAYQKNTEVIQELIGRIHAIIGVPQRQPVPEAEPVSPTPQQPQSRPEPQAEPAKPVTQDPDRQPTPAVEARCPACHFTETTPLPRKVLSRNFRERAIKSISFFMGLLFLLVSSIISIVALYRVSLLVFPCMVIGALLGRHIAHNWITRLRLREGHQVLCHRCNRCKKVFNVVVDL